MYVTAETLIAAAAVLAAVTAIFGAIFGVYRWYLKRQKNDKDIQELKEEMGLLTYGVLCCLKGLKERGCNGPVTEAISKIEKHLNEQAHK